MGFLFRSTFCFFLLIYFKWNPKIFLDLRCSNLHNSDPTVFQHPREIRRIGPADPTVSGRPSRWIFHHPIPYGFLIIKIKQVVEPGRSKQNSSGMQCQTMILSFRAKPMTPPRMRKQPLPMTRVIQKTLQLHGVHPYLMQRKIPLKMRSRVQLIS